MGVHRMHGLRWSRIKGGIRALAVSLTASEPSFLIVVILPGAV